MRWTGTKRNSGVGKNSGLILSRLWTKVHEILRQRRTPFVLSNAFAWLFVSRFVQRISPLSLEVVEKPNKCKSFLAPIFSEGTTPTFLRHIVNATYRPPFDKVWLSSVCWCPSAKSASEVECGILRRVGKNYGPIWSRLWTKVRVVFRRCSRPLVVCNALARLSVSFRRYRPLKLPLSCEIAKKGGFWASDL